MSPRLAAAHRWAITTARAYERAAEYGINAGPARHEYELARNGLALAVTAEPHETVVEPLVLGGRFQQITPDQRVIGLAGAA